MLSCRRLDALAVVGILLVGIACSSPESQRPEGTRQVVSVEGLDAFKDSKVGYLRHFANQHAPFWRPSRDESAACESLLSSGSSLAGLRAPLRSYHLQFAGVSLNNERLVLVHGFCPQGPKTASFTRLGGELVFLPLHWGTCYFEAYCALDKREVRSVTFSTEGR